ncbi:multiheme c-type cytochrome [Halofilum ochraceum]|uniref:multiheme c-type cytochrome n=1 Tax=Halofilum ochraceum TaxID=1611323 RepID=UPI001585F418|nr:multiheme c-type cytochrome [Halofilum ochraceum]
MALTRNKKALHLVTVFVLALPLGAVPASAADDDLLSGDGDGQGTSSGDDLLGGDNGDASGNDLLNADDDGGGSGDDLLGGEGESDGGDGGLLGDDDGSDGGDLPSGDLLGGDDDGGDEADSTDTAEEEEGDKSAYEMHKAAFEDAGNRYPSANECATCHPRQYRQWSVSQHAYAQLSPVYMAMQMTINAKTSGTNGDFCIRCHNQVGMNLGESVYTSNLDRHPTSREGVTCVVCHRVKQPYGKVSGRLPLEEGGLTAPVYGPSGGEELERVLSNPETYRVVTDPEKAGRKIHEEARQFFQITEPDFCGTCHDVKLLNGFRLEEAFSEYQRTEAAENDVSCQDCHMGKEQGVPSGYERGPAAVVGGEPTKPRKLTNHYFAGPDYPIIHPGLFPHNVEAAKFKSMRQWLKFDHEAGWGTDEFEESISLDREFPDAWFAIDDRYDAREILDEQFERLEWARQERLEVLRNGFELSDIQVTESSSEDGLDFEIDVRNPTNGHAVPTGFDAERVIFLQVEVRDQDGRLIYVSGDRDPNGDIRDSHSLYVHDGRLPLDEDLFSLQSKFVVRMARGGEREEVLSLNHSGSPQPFIRPETRATTIYGRPRGARKHKMTIPPLGKRTADYSVAPEALNGNGPYTIDVELIAQMVPVNLIAAIQDVGFDYGMSPKEIADRVVEGAEIVREKRTTIEIADPEKPTQAETGLPEAAKTASADAGR